MYKKIAILFVEYITPLGGGLQVWYGFTFYINAEPYNDNNELDNYVFPKKKKLHLYTFTISHYKIILSSLYLYKPNLKKKVEHFLIFWLKINCWKIVFK